MAHKYTQMEGIQVLALLPEFKHAQVETAS
jgi:hypothetical protein